MGAILSRERQSKRFCGFSACKRTGECYSACRGRRLAKNTAKPTAIRVKMRDGGTGVLDGATGTDALAILLPPDSVSHRLLSGPVAISQGAELGVGMVNSVMFPKGVIRPTLPANS